MVLRVLELYSGIGGMHYAVMESGVSAEVVAAVDINTIANQVYQVNFPDSNLMQRSIEGITVNQFDKLKIDVILMSPPCQPFTRIGLQADSADPRTKSFFHVLDLIQRSSAPPGFILLENVKGFESSDTRNHLITTLKNCHYQFQEFLLSPNQFGIPNSRLRYFLLAKRHPHQFHFKLTDQILESLPNKCANSCCGEAHDSAIGHMKGDSSLPKDSEGVGETSESAPSVGENTNTETVEAKPLCASPSDSAASTSSCLATGDNGKQTVAMETTPIVMPTQCCQNSCTCANVQLSVQCSGDSFTDKDEMKYIREFLEDEGKDFSQYLVGEKILVRFGRLMDIVKPSCQRSCCFTKGYHHYVEGTGSVLQMNTQIDMAETFKKIFTLSDDDPNKIQLLSSLQLRYFTPREVASLMSFPHHFNFPESTSLKQRYRLLGNSLNVHVVARLLKDYLLDNCFQIEK
ncbi:tRNA (cytosine(38)-C(5))-methyltransferase-like [Glandiceps talaboti]